MLELLHGLPGLIVGRQNARHLHAIPGVARFLSAFHTNHAGTRNYKLYIPSAYYGQPLPLVVMLHGCKQDPDDFAAGTRMNALAEEYHCLVAYPAQGRSANGFKCWNWFNSLNQQRDHGEPSIIAGITCDIIDNWNVDTQRIYVAGLSAGGAMAVIMGTTYPELYAAVGVHSGLAYAGAHDARSAFAAMKHGAQPVSGAEAVAEDAEPMPIIVFHGDQDAVVHPDNGAHVIAQNAPATAQHVVAEGSSASVEQGAVADGHTYTRTIHTDLDGQVAAEHWVVHGAGHAWSGGSPAGSFTDPKGPDASQEMLRFFLKKKNATAAAE
jgi:poly(hydroxyalkanoate) depolymerase family esterase